MKRLFITLMMLFLIYIGIEMTFNYFSKTKEEEYEIVNNNITFKIKETVTDENNYFFDVSFNNKNFTFQIFHDFNKTGVINDIKYFKNDKYECLLPMFDNEVLMNMVCLNEVNNYYYDLNDPELNRFANSIYNFPKSDKYKKVGNIIIYEDNLISNHYINFTNYKGVYNISKDFNSLLYNISLFEKDVINPKISLLTDKYYVVADYNSQYEFNKIYIVDLEQLETYEVKTKAISFDSYIQGNISNNIYLYDKENKIQYELNLEKRKIIEFSSTVKNYVNNEWVVMTPDEINNEVKFINDIDYENDSYVRIDKVGDKTGYYYLYKKNKNSYDAYRINIQDKKGLTYLFSTTNINDISYVDNNVYFIDKNTIKVFNDKGIKTLVKYNELEFNNNISFNVFAK